MNRMQGLMLSEQRTQKNTEPKAFLAVEEVRPYNPYTPFAENTQSEWNTSYANLGNEDTTDGIIDSKIFIGKPDDPVAAKQIADEFDEWWRSAMSQHRKTLLIAAGRKGSFFTFNGPFLRSDDMRDLRDRTKTFYVVTRFEYSDHSGRWVSDNCFAFQNPVHDLIVEHPCLIPERPRYRIKRPY